MAGTASSVVSGQPTPCSAKGGVAWCSTFRPVAREVGLQSGDEPGPGSFHVIGGSVSRLEASPVVPRRRSSVVAKEPIVPEATVPGVNVSANARSHGLSPQQVFAWRREAVQAASPLLAT